jgi:hypothetical protein
MRKTRQDEILHDHNGDGDRPARLSAMHGVGWNRGVVRDAGRGAEILQHEPHGENGR